MTATALPRTLCVLLAIALLLWAAGCGSSAKNVERAGKTVGSMDSFTESLEAGKTQITTAIEAMNAIEGSADRIAAYKTFVKEIEKTEKAAERARKRANAMRKHGEAYFSTWLEKSAQISSDELRAISEARQEELSASFNTIKVAADKAKDHYDPFMEALYDIQLYLGNDLTDAGFTAIKPFQETATGNAGVVNGELDKIIEEVGKVKTVLTPAAGGGS